LRRGLEEEGHSVLSATNGEAGFRCARTEPLDAVVLDLMLPDRDGLSVLRALRREGVAIPVLIVTARDAIDDRVTGLDSGADDYLVKPFAFTELVARLRALLRRNRPERETRLVAGDLEIDRLARRVLRRGVELDLTGRQFELLEYLVRHANETVTREMIVRDVWKDNTGILTNVVEVCVNHLRRRLERPDWLQVLHTIRGVGYELRGAAWHD
jgi:DNA-binding response OmpR family regulator